MRRPTYIRVVAEVVFEVPDPPAVHAAARQAISSRKYTGGKAGRAEQQRDLEDAATDISKAALELVDPSLMLGVDSGALEVTSTVSAEACDQQGRPIGDKPDYAALFAVCHCGESECQRCGSFQLTPRNAALLNAAANWLADEAYGDIEEHGDAPVDQRGWALFSDYPRLTFHENAVWRRQAARAFDDLASDLEAGDEPQPRCIGEEMALHLMLDWVRSTCSEEPEVRDEITAGLPAHAHDHDWELVFECLVQDDDLSALFQPAEDGIEDPEGETNRMLGMGDYRPAAGSSGS